ncbi:MAG: hypothetical protein CMJ18_14665 [Phycisphaeraceae bacterium]|nr:hypothetical protein [Phycisphaeraceae bacterium]
MPPTPVDWYRQCLGPLPQRGRVTGVALGAGDVGPWTVERLEIRNDDEAPIPAVMLRPEGVGRPPVVVAHHGWSEGKDIFMFGPHSGIPSVKHPGAAHLVSHGLAVLGIDARAHGDRLAGAPDRREDEPAWFDFFQTEWAWLHRQCIIDGLALQGLLIHDVQCAIDYLETRDDVDAARLGMYGYSMGGTTCWSTTVVEPRIRVAVAGGCMLTYESALRVRRDASWHAWVPSLRRHASREALVASIAPRPLMAIQGEDDFPRDGVEPIMDAARQAYSAQGCSDLFRATMLPGDHVTAACDPRLLEETGRWLADQLD